MILIIPEGRGIIWNKTRRRKRKRRGIMIVECGLRNADSGLGIVDCGIIIWMAQRIMIKRMPSSIREKAQTSIDPSAMGVETRRKIRISLMRRLIIVIESLGHWSLSQ
jgi:hypothetical protein